MKPKKTEFGQSRYLKVDTQRSDEEVTFEKLNNDLMLLDAMMANHTASECDADPKILAARKNIHEEVESFIQSYVKGVDQEKAAMIVAHILFDQYCEGMLNANAMLKAPRDFLDMEEYSTEEEVIEEANDITEYCEYRLNIAKVLWIISELGMEHAV